MKEKMRILVVEPVKRPYVKEIDHTLEEMQKVVGGSIQALYPFEDRVGLICNDEAKIAGVSHQTEHLEMRMGMFMI